MYQYRGSLVQIFEDYTPEVAEERAKYWSVMAYLFNLALRPMLLFPARLQITLENGKKKRFSSPEEATSFIGEYQQALEPVQLSLKAVSLLANVCNANLVS